MITPPMKLELLTLPSNFAYTQTDCLCLSCCQYYSVGSFMGINSPGMISGIMCVMLSILLCLFIHGDQVGPIAI